MRIIDWSSDVCSSDLAWGDHPYGRHSSPSADSLATIDRPQIAAFTHAVLARANLVIGAVGDIEPGELAALVDASFGALPAHAGVPLPAPVAPKTPAQPVVIDFPNPKSPELLGAPGDTQSAVEEQRV